MLQYHEQIVQNWNFFFTTVFFFSLENQNSLNETQIFLAHTTKIETN